MATDIKLQECRVLRIEPGDIVVFETDKGIATDVAREIKGQLAERFAAAGHPDVQCLVIGGGGHLTKTRVE